VRRGRDTGPGYPYDKGAGGDRYVWWLLNSSGL